MPGIRIAPIEVDRLAAWAFTKESVQRAWVLSGTAWGDRRDQAALSVAVQLAAVEGLPACDTDGWETELNQLVPPDVQLTVIPAGTDAAGLGGVEIFHRA